MQRIPSAAALEAAGEEVLSFSKRKALTQEGQEGSTKKSKKEEDFESSDRSVSQSVE